MKRPPSTPLLLVLFFLSGAAALIYEVLWLKELGRLFGVTAHATATTLSVFFLGLAAGGYVWGRRSSRLTRPLATYARLEIGIAVGALLYFLLLDAYHAIYGPLFALVGDRSTLFLLLKFALATGILFPAAFFMGGTLPVMGQYLVRGSDQLGRVASLLYAINTIGAATGALAAGFFLPRLLGFRLSYLLAIGMSLLVAAVAYRASAADDAPPGRQPAAPRMDGTVGAATGRTPVALLAALSGFLTLSLEVLWTRMFAQVLQNSVYTFALILTVFLVALAAGSIVAHRLCRLAHPPPLILATLLLVSGLAVGLTPWSFFHLTRGLEPVGLGLDWTGYVLAVFGIAATVLLPAGVLVGSVFPYLMKVVEGRSPSAGRTIGRLAAINTVFGVLGSLAAGFLLLELLGLWGSLRTVGIGYLLLGFAVPVASIPARRVLRSAAAIGALLLALWIPYGNYAKVRLDAEHGERVVDLREGSHGTVAVLERNGDLRIKADNSYLLGTAASAPNERIQTWLPLGLHPDPRSVFFLGMGTGITAGAALALPIKRLLVCELNADVVRMSREHFGPYVFGLHSDPRSTVLAEDGRNYLYATRERFDLIIGDIFLTYRVGVGSLFTVEHFRAVRKRLAAGGLFVQWLPLFDMSFEELAIVTRTMLEAFPEATFWRRSVSPRFPVVALVARVESEPLDLPRLERHLGGLADRRLLPRDVWLREIPLSAYMGNARTAEALFENAPLSTDDRTPLEYLAPLTNRDSGSAGTATVLAWGALAEFGARLLDAAPAESDPFLRDVEPRVRRQVPAGLAYYRYVVASRSNLPEEAARNLQAYRRLLDLDATSTK